MNIGSIGTKSEDFYRIAAQLHCRKVLHEYRDPDNGGEKTQKIYEVDETYPYIFTAHRKARNGRIIRTSFTYSQIVCGEVRILKD